MLWARDRLLWGAGKSRHAIAVLSGGQVRLLRPLHPALTKPGVHVWLAGRLPGNRIVYAVGTKGFRVMKVDGRGDQPLLPCRARGRVLGTRMSDRIDVRNGRRDSVRCGDRFETVIADRRDVVARDCERVLRG